MFCCFEFGGVRAGLFGESLTSVGFDGGHVVGAVRDPGGEVLDGLFQVGCGVGRVECHLLSDTLCQLLVGVLGGLWAVMGGLVMV